MNKTICIGPLYSDIRHLLFENKIYNSASLTFWEEAFFNFCVKKEYFVFMKPAAD